MYRHEKKVLRIPGYKKRCIFASNICSNHKVMEEIFIYRTDWKDIIGGIICLLFCGVSVFALYHGKAGEI